MILLVVALFPLIKSAENFCCERTTSGATCVDAAESECNTNFRTAPSSCESTSFCKTGTCVNSIEGTCMPNTPQVICEEAGGLWKEEDKDEIAQCQLGCCYVGDGAVFTTSARCSSLASIYNLDIDYRTDITNELECIASAESTAKGACVIRNEYETTCRFLTQKECNALETTSTSSGILDSLFDSGSTEVSEIVFYDGYLCSAEELGADCGPSERTTCVEGKNQVYFLDTCGNLANVYDSTWKETKPDYWTKIYSYEDTCGAGENNANSATCGNCDYYLGSVCSEYAWKDGDAKPTYGNYICKDLGCEYNGETYEHGEEWCESFNIDGTFGRRSQGTFDTTNYPGSRHYVMSCYAGEIGIEPCADARQEICLEENLNEDFTTAGCVANAWQNCYAYTTEEDCKNIDLSDCNWTKGGEKFLINEDQEEEGYCVPTYPPGFDFWNSTEKDTIENQDYCSIGTSICVIEYETTFIDSLKGEGRNKLEDASTEVKVKNCVKNCQCIEGYDRGYKTTKEFEETEEYDLYDSYDNWLSSVQNRCISLGDCGVSVNYKDILGYNSNPDLITEDFMKLTNKGEVK